MAESPNTISVSILDKDYLVSCLPSEETQLRESAQYLDRQMRDIRNSGKVHGIERIAVMAALNIAHQFIQAQRQNAGNQETAARLAQRIDELLQTD